jgi:Tol biopolymer transport system component
MNKDLLDQLSADERQTAEKLSSAAETMKLSQSFQWNLETKLMDAHPSQNEKQNSRMKFLKPFGWVLAAVAAVLLAGWMLRTLLPGIQPAVAPTIPQEVSFEENVRQGNICAAPLAMSHNFSVFLTNTDKTQFTVVDAGDTIVEIRSFTWSTDGTELFLFGNTTGSSKFFHADPISGEVTPVPAGGELGYMMDAAWSRDGKKVALRSGQNNKVLYLMNADGTGLIEKQMKVQILGTPQFYPDGNSIVFFGANTYSTGLFEWVFSDAEVLMINDAVESATSYAFSSDASHLAYMRYDREQGLAQLWVEDLTAGNGALLGTFPIPKGSGSAVPTTANMSWSADGTSIVFDVGRGANDRVIYLARVDGTELLQVVDAGYAPAISSDGKCLAYMNNKQLFLLDLTAASNSIATTPMLLGDLPAGRGDPNYQLDKLQWKP